MKYSQLIGVVAALGVIFSCTLPWSYVAEHDVTISGLHAVGTRFGRPGLINIFTSVISVLCFLVPKVWAKRTNVFAVVFGLSWTIRNYILVTTCMAGECPEKRVGLYLLVCFTVVVTLMAFLPKIDLKPED